MKKDLHPTDYRLVVFQDTSSDLKILTRSCAPTTESIKWEDGNEYPLIKVHVSSASHPFIEGRVDKFKARAEAAAKAKEAKIAAAKKSEKKPVKKAAEKKEVAEEDTKESKTDSEK